MREVLLRLHGLTELVEVPLKLTKDTPIPLVGWELYLDIAGTYRVREITLSAEVLTEQDIWIDAVTVCPSDKRDAAQVMEDLRNSEFDAIGEPEVHSICYCNDCREARKYRSEKEGNPS